MADEPDLPPPERRILIPGTLAASGITPFAAAWPARTWSPGERVSAGMMNTLRDQLNELHALVGGSGGGGAIPDSSLSPNVALKNIDNNFSTTQRMYGATITGPSSAVNMIDPTSPVDKRWWRLVSYSNGDLYMEGLNDAGNTYRGGRLGFMDNGAVQLLNSWLMWPAAAVPSSNANVMDDYEEGLWTPELKFGGNNVGMTYTEHPGYYIKMGGWVWVGYRIIVSAKGSSVGGCTIMGVPFAESGSLNMGGQFHYMTTMHTSLTIFPSVYITGATIMVMYPSSGSIVNLSDAHFLPGALIGMLFYRAT